MQQLWTAIIAAYARPGVAALCLRLQADGDIDVMLLLALCYAGATLNAPLTPDEVGAVRALSEPWRATAVRPARQLRIALRAPVPAVPDDARESLRERLKAAELASEQIQADIIARWLTTRTGPAAATPYPGLRALLAQTPATDAELALLLDAFRR